MMVQTGMIHMIKLIYKWLYRGNIIIKRINRNMSKITINEDKFLKLKDLLHILKEELTDMQYQCILLKVGIVPSVGVRDATGYYTADTFIHVPEKSTAGKPHFERAFSPFY